MAVIGQSYYDLIEKFNTTDATRQYATIIELLKATNPILEDALSQPCNQGVSHLTSVRSGLPAVVWGQLYKGIPQSKSGYTQVEDTTGFVEGLSTVDKRLINLAEDKKAARLSEGKGFLESLSQDMAGTVWYGNVATDPKKFTGFAPRFNDSTAPNGGQIVDGGGTDAASNTSIWFLGWGDEANHFIHPKGVPAGIVREDKGEQRVTDDDGNPFYAMEEYFAWHNGLTVRDMRMVVRVANIDVEALRAGTVDIYKLMRKGFWKLRRHQIPGGRISVYCNADVLEALDGQSTPTSSTSASFVRLSPKEIEGKEVLTYRNFPVRQSDALLNTEDPVTFA